MEKISFYAMIVEGELYEGGMCARQGKWQYGVGGYSSILYIVVNHSDGVKKGTT